MSNRGLVAVMLMLLPVCGMGCGTAIKRGLGEVIGASAAVQWTVRGAPPASQFRTIRGLAVGEVTNTVGATCPRQTVATVRPAITRAFAELTEEYPGGEPLLTADVAVQWYKTSGALSALLGPESWFVWLVNFRCSDGQAPPPLLVIAHSKAARTSDADLAEAGAQALAKCLRKIKRPEEAP